VAPFSIFFDLDRSMQGLLKAIATAIDAVNRGQARLMDGADLHADAYALSVFF
jgi:hypothetical protein